MRHGKLNKRFGRNRSARKELMRSLARNTIIHSSITTTLSKAKEAAKLVNRLISLGKTGSLSDIRAAFDILQERSLVSRLVKEIAPLFTNRAGGYTRIIRLGNRHGDGTQMAILQLVEKVKEKPKPKKPKAVKPKQEPKVEEKIAEKQPPAPKEKEKPVPPKVKAEPKKEKPPKAKKEKPKKEGWLDRVKGIFKRKKD